MQARRSVATATLFVLVGLLVALLGAAAPVGAQGSTTTVVRNNNIATSRANAKANAATPWFRNAATGGGSVGFMTGPATPPLGTGSLKVATTSGSSKAQLFNYSYAGRKLSDLTSLAYRTYRDPSSTNSMGQVPALNLEVDYAGTGSSYTALVFEPIYNTSQGAIAAGVWQSWDAYASGTAVWWSSQAIPGVCATSCYVTWATILANNPNARITSATQSFSQYGGLGISLGSGWANVFNGSVDRLAVGFSGTETVYDFEPGCALDCYVSTSGNDANQGTSYSDAKRTIQAAIDTVQAGGTVHVNNGTYAESPRIAKSLTLTSENGAALTTIDLQTGPTYLGSLEIGGQNVTVNGFTIEGFDGSSSALAATNVTVLPNLGTVVVSNNVLKVGAVGSFSNGDDGIGVETYYDTSNDTDSLTLTNNRFQPLGSVGTRAFYVNPGTDAFLAQGNLITGNFQYSAATQAKNGVVRGNTVTGTGASASLGTWGYPNPNVYGRTEFEANTISGTATGFRIRGSNNVTIHHNIVSGVGEGVTVFDNPSDGITGQLDGATVVIRDNSFTGLTGTRVTNSGYPNAVNASANWWGSAAVSAGDVTGAVDYTPVLTSGTDTSVSAGFQGSVAELKAHTLGAQVGTEGRIQEGIDTTVANGIVDVAPGSYSETATGRTTPQVGPTYQFGLYVGTDRTGVTVRGVDASDAPITDSSGTLALVTTNATNNFGSSGTFVYGSNATFQGLEFGANNGGSNKTFEVIGDGFRLLDSYVNDSPGSIYLNDWTYDTGNDRSSIATFTISGNRFASDNQITIASGTGHGRPASGRVISDNTFVAAPTGLFISFRGAAGPGGVPWYTLPVGGATITGNTFGPADINIRATDDYDNSQLDWTAIRANNTFDRLVWVGVGTSDTLRSFSYSSGGYAFANARQLGGRIDSANAARPAGVDIAQAGDVVHVHSGTYPEQALLDKANITVEGYGPTKPLVDDGGAATGYGLYITGDGVTLSNVKVQGYEVGVRLGGGSDSLLDGVSVLGVESTNNSGDGLFGSAIAGLSNVTITGGTYANNANTGTTLPGGRGIVIWDGPKSNVSITNVTASNNGLVGIDINDGNVTGLTITGNTVTGNADSGIGVLGAKGPGANLIANNTLTNNGRYGIEVKSPTGTGAASGPGSVVVSGNHVSRAPGATPSGKDFAGIAVFRRSVSVLNADQPTGAYVVGNDVSGYRYTGADHDGFGIVVEGAGTTVTQNVVSNNDVGVQAQAGNPNGLPGDAQPDLSDYFDRGNAASYASVVTGNSITGNTTNFRAIGLTGAADASGNWWGTTDQDAVDAAIVGDVDFTPYFHTGTDTSAAAGFQGDYSALDVVRIGAQVGSGPRIQEAIDMVTGSTVYVHAGLYVEDVDANVAHLNLYGAHQGDAVAGRTFGDATEATIQGKVRISATDVTFDGFSVTTAVHAGSLTGILVESSGDGAAIANSIISDITSTSPNTNGTNAQAIYLERGPDDVSITGNRIATVSSYGSAKGIYVGDSTANDPSTGVLIDGNVITGVTSTARGAYGIQHNNGLTGGGHAQLTISGNTINGLTGGWVHAIGIEADAPDLSIHHNRVSGLTAAGADNVAVFFESDPSWADAEVHNNDLAVGPSAFGVGLHPTFAIPGSVDATCNWWGSASGPGPVMAGTGAPVGPSVDGNPWLTSSNLDGNCDGIVQTVAPTASLSFAEGTAAANGGAFDNATAAIVANVGAIGTLTDHHDGTWSWALAADSTQNDGPASGTITLTATTTLGATATTSFSYAITNVAPSGTFVAPAEVAVGDAFDIGFDPTVDPSAGDTFTYAFQCGAASPVTGSADTTTCAAPTSAQVGTLIHVTGRITDDDGGVSTLYEDDVLVVAALTLSPSAHDFGSVQVDEFSAPVTFTLTNHSNVAYDIDEVGFFVTVTNHFQVVGATDECSEATLPAHGSCTFEVVFNPQAPGPRQTTLGAQFDGTQPPLPKATSALTGLGIAPEATVAPDGLDFGSRAIGTGPSTPQTVTVTNTGDAGSTLTITSIVRTGSSAFDVDHDALAPLGAGESLAIDVTFDPSTVGDHDGSLVITTNAGNFSVPLSGVGEPGPVLSITPSSHNFGDVTVDHAKTKQFTVANTGTDGLTGLVVTVSGDDLSIVAGDSTCDETTDLDVGGSCVVTVRYQPDEVGDDTGTLAATADGGVADSSNLTGSGVAAKPIVTVDPDEHEFDDVVVGGTPDRQEFEVRNTGDATLTGLDVQLTGAPAFDIVEADSTCDDTTTLAPDATCVVTVEFAPGTGGDKTATLKVHSANAGNGTVNVPLSGTALAPELSITPSGYNFGDVTVDHSKSRTFAVANSGTATLTGLDVQVTGDDLSIVADDSDCDETTSLDPGESCQVKVRYQPDEAGDDTGSLDATADDGLSDSATLRGSGVPAKGLVSVTPDEGAFGSVEVETSQVVDFTVENTGDASLTFSSVALTGSSTFAIEPSDDTDCLTEDATLAPGDSCVVRVRFAPGSVGDRSGTLKIQSNAANATVNVPLNGTSTPHPSNVSVTPNPYDFGHVPFKATKSKRFTVTNSGGTPVTITSVTRTGSSTYTVVAADDECDGETLGTDESCSFVVRFKAPSSTAGVKSGVIHLIGSGFDEIQVPVTATAEPFKAKVDAFVTDKTDRPSNYVGVGVYCKASCPQQQAVETVTRGRTFTYRVRIRNNGNGVDDIRVRLYQTGSKASIQRIQVLRNGNQDVTSRVTNGSYVARDMNPGAEIYFWVRVTVRTNAVPGRVNYVQLSGQSTRTPSVQDVVRARTTVR
ncbi:MAG: choice-of-anchor D domain-containing protein [Chloroflexota bacterium]